MTYAQLKRIASFKASIELVSGLKPKNNGTFPLIEARDVLVGEEDERLDNRLESIDNKFSNINDQIKTVSKDEINSLFSGDLIENINE